MSIPCSKYYGIENGYLRYELQPLTKKSFKLI